MGAIEKAIFLWEIICCEMPLGMHLHRKDVEDEKEF